MLINACTGHSLSGAALNNIIYTGVQDPGKAPALASSWKGYQLSHIPSGRRRNWNRAAELLLREVGAIQRSTAAYCGIVHCLNKLDNRIASANWKKLFGPRYKQAEKQIVEVVAASSVNITNFVNLLDVFNDLLIDAVFQVDGTIGNYVLGKIGSALNPNSRFSTKYPALFLLANEVHDRRYQSMASHPLIKRSGTPTKKINFRFLSTAKRLLSNAVNELRLAGFS